MPAVYPVCGRKKKRDTAWSDYVLRDRQVFRANTLKAIRAAFEDHATIASLGLGSVLNIPVLRTVVARDAGWCVGTINLLHEAGWYTSGMRASSRRAKNPKSPAVRREAIEDWGRKRQ